MLTGSDLLDKVKELGDVSKSDLVKACGYVSSKKDGGERLNFTAFYEALLEAKGVVSPPWYSRCWQRRTQAELCGNCPGNGNLLINVAYTAMLDLKPGDNFQIKLGKKPSV